jgi:hypothetical protein
MLLRVDGFLRKRTVSSVNGFKSVGVNMKRTAYFATGFSVILCSWGDSGKVIEEPKFVEKIGCEPKSYLPILENFRRVSERNSLIYYERIDNSGPPQRGMITMASANRAFRITIILTEQVVSINGFGQESEKIVQQLKDDTSRQCETS